MGREGFYKQKEREREREGIRVRKRDDVTAIVTKL